MSKEKYLGESTLTDTPKKKLNLKIRDGSITAEKLDPQLLMGISKMEAITNEEIDDLF